MAVPEMQRLQGSNLKINAAVWAGGSKSVLFSLIQKEIKSSVSI